MNLSDFKAQASRLGFSFAGATRAEPSPYLAAYFQWIEAHMHGTMGYLARPDRQLRRRDLNVILPGVRSLLIVGLDYRTLPIDPAILSDPSRGRIASYAWGLDYHDLMIPKLNAIVDSLGVEARVYVDTGAILERSHAMQAGIGFTGKNTMLIHPRRGSYFFLGEILTTLAFDEYDTPHRATQCGTCTRCLTACPTDAFPRPYVLDARRCISYLTIEHKGTIDPMLRPLIGNWVYGCDVCQEVCPWQRFALPSAETGFYPVDLDRVAPRLQDLLVLDEAAFRDRFAGSAITRIGRDRMVRNACIAAGNAGDASLTGQLIALTADPSAIVSEAAAWALQKR
ncbi:MAG: tRNA epoxyqueuosine(34) reductase QueG [Anaerolineae bacterium]|nr:tRNA epoxyqueuosine(34) reductase QueG [Anaerolineae bacterium]